MSDAEQAPTPQPTSNSQGALPTPQTHPLVFKLACEIGKPLSFFDIEATGINCRSDRFGVTEFAFLAVMPNGKAHAHSSLINPENPIEQRASEITGLTNEMLADKPTVGQHASKIVKMMERSVMFGFNCDSYDTPALLLQLDRYQVERPAEWSSVDMRSIWCSAHGVKKGTQSEVAEHYGVPFTGAHRALADCSALADIMEQMLWRHGVELVHSHARLNWDGVARDADGSVRAPRASRPSSRGGETTPAQSALKAALDEAIPKKLSVEQFADELASKGFKLEITKGGAAYIVQSPAGSEPERCSGSQLGAGYVWKDIRSTLSGDIPQRLYGTGPVFGERGARPEKNAEDKASEAASEARAKDALLELAKAGGPLDLARAAELSGSTPKSVSFAVSRLLADGLVQPAQVSVDEAQKWLDERWDQLPTGGLLTPLLGTCEKLGAPASVDFTQLRVAKAFRKAAMPTRAPASAPAPRSEAASSQGSGRLDNQGGGYSQRSTAPALRAEPNYDDVPPFDDDSSPIVSRSAP